MDQLEEKIRTKNGSIKDVVENKIHYVGGN